jgi:hypothetical protein
MLAHVLQFNNVHEVIMFFDRKLFDGFQQESRIQLSSRPGMVEGALEGLAASLP